MRRAVATLVAALALPLSACQPGSSQSAPPRSDLAQALPAPAELPGTTWILVGTTDHAPDDESENSPLADARGATPSCRAAVSAMETASGATSGTTGFARAVYRTQTSTTGRDLNLTIESRPDAAQLPASVTAMTKACTARLRTQAGDQEVVMRIRPAVDSVPGAVGYTITYDTEGLVDAFDMLVLTRGGVSISASITGPDSATNRAVLRPAALKAAAKLDALGR